MERNKAMDDFNQGNVKILIGTDVIGRGIDFPNVSMIINYDTPKNLEDYIHRIGRTGRCGNKGLAISFINETCRPVIDDLYNLLFKHSVFIPNSLKNMYNEGKSYNGYKENFNVGNMTENLENDDIIKIESNDFVLEKDYFYETKEYSSNNFSNLINKNEYYMHFIKTNEISSSSNKMSWRK